MRNKDLETFIGMVILMPLVVIWFALCWRAIVWAWPG